MAVAQATHRGGVNASARLSPPVHPSIRGYATALSATGFVSARIRGVCPWRPRDQPLMLMTQEVGVFAVCLFFSLYFVV